LNAILLLLAAFLHVTACLQLEAVVVVVVVLVVILVVWMTKLKS
jgi:hypothetical protein